MAVPEDDVDRLLRRLREQQEQWKESLFKGTAAPDNSRNGYYATVARIEAFETAIEVVREIFRGWLGPDAKPETRRAPVEY